jgi:hypothetical protein
MRKFLLLSVLFLAGALVAAVLIFWWLNNTTVLLSVSEQVKSFIDTAPTPNEVSSEVKTTIKSEDFAIPVGGIKLSTLALGESQKKALQTAGINIDTFVITETMISCGVGKLGEARASEIFAGATPSLLEIGKLLPCLRK